MCAAPRSQQRRDSGIAESSISRPPESSVTSTTASLFKGSLDHRFGVFAPRKEIPSLRTTIHRIFSVDDDDTPNEVLLPQPRGHAFVLAPDSRQGRHVRLRLHRKSPPGPGRTTTMDSATLGPSLPSLLSCSSCRLPPAKVDRRSSEPWLSSSFTRRYISEHVEVSRTPAHTNTRTEVLRLHLDSLMSSAHVVLVSAQRVYSGSY